MKRHVFFVFEIGYRLGRRLTKIVFYITSRKAVLTTKIELFICAFTSYQIDINFIPYLWLTPYKQNYEVK